MAQYILSQFRPEMLDYMAYSPDLAPSVFDIFWQQKMGRKKFCTNGIYEGAVETCLNTLEEIIYEEGIGKLAHQYDKCL